MSTGKLWRFYFLVTMFIDVTNTQKGKPLILDSRPTDQQTDMKACREITLPII